MHESLQLRWVPHISCFCEMWEGCTVATRPDGLKVEEIRRSNDNVRAERKPCSTSGLRSGVGRLFAGGQRRGFVRSDRGRRWRISGKMLVRMIGDGHLHEVDP
jgi:hypothetical protein